ncbi:hypothetical protein bcere0025_57600 [Bacillus cereus F65185]|nr:hypothetical protein bcere0025_57600 [Bacillus cereus F65185]
MILLNQLHLEYGKFALKHINTFNQFIEMQYLHLLHEIGMI